MQQLINIYCPFFTRNVKTPIYSEWQRCNVKHVPKIALIH